jgi:hypothetical protein
MKLVVGCVLLAGVVASFAWPPAPDPEVARLQRHFAAVLEELRGRDVSQLTPAQRAARARHIERLAAYAARGEFPKNHDFAERTPYFVDRDGTRCAMAYLIEQAGSGEYVRAVAASMNNALVGDIARDPSLGPALQSWVAANGLTLDEAARIQPSYCGTHYSPIFGHFPRAEYYEENCITSDTEMMLQFSTVVGGMVLTTINLFDLLDGKDRAFTGWLGVSVGGLVALMRANELVNVRQHYPPSLRHVTTVVGGVSLLAGIYALKTRDQAGQAMARAEPARLRAAPLFEPARAGFVLNLNF